MRTFEILLILANLFSLGLGFKKQIRAVWLGIAGANIFLLLIHGIFEGFRYQMDFSYIFVLLLAVYTFLKTNYRFEPQTPKALKMIGICLSFVCLAFTALLAYALPVFALPKLTGNYPVGVQYFHLIDENRTDPFLDPSMQPRELMLKVYYPAEPDEAKPFASYFHSPALIKLFTAFYGLPDFLFDHLHLVATHEKENLQLADRERSYPVVLFSHGAGTSMEVQTSQSEDLASHGYIVVAIDHTYVSAATVFPDRIVSAKEATRNFNVAEPAEVITQIMADDASFVMDTMEEMNEGKIESIFKGKLDLARIGAIGHSVGGAVAYNLAINDHRVKAAINLDGRVYITPKGDPKIVVPFLMLASDAFIQTIRDRTSLMKQFAEMTDEEQKITLSMYGSAAAYQEAYSKDIQNMIGLTEVLKASGNLFTIEGSAHMKFTDIGLFIGLPQVREIMGIGGKTGPVKCLEITKAVTVAFFDRYLKGEPKDSLESLLTKYPELKRVYLE